MRLYNTLSATKEEFVTSGAEVKMYVCGVTPYSETHMGHAMSNIIFDVVRRNLLFHGHRVKYVQNITDIDDKIIERAAARGVPPSELAQDYTERFFQEMERLNVLRPDISPRATEEISVILDMVRTLIDKGHAYAARGSVYFRVQTVPDYGKLSRRSVDRMLVDMSGSRLEDKEHPMDFALWKASKAGEPSWDSPWGPGRPGWHIECSAIVLKYLGESIDIHGGGLDLLFPHHENEIAQSENYSGVQPFAKYWMHNGLLQFDKEKMSKSLGNLVTVREALKKSSPDGLRVFVLSSHYRSPLTYSEDALQAAEKNADRLRQAAAHDPVYGESHGSVAVEDFTTRFMEAMDDDFNTPRALVVLYDLAKEINRRTGAEINTVAAQATLRDLSQVLGLTLDPVDNTAPDQAHIARLVSSHVASGDDYGATSLEIHDVRTSIDRLIGLRTHLRRERRWQEADVVRDELEQAGVILEDSPQGTRWKLKPRVLAGEQP